MRDPKLPDPNMVDPNYSPYIPGNMYQQEMDRIVRRAREEAAALFARARANGHFPDDPGYADEFGDPINRSIDKAEQHAARGWAALSQIRPLLRVEALADDYSSI